MFGSIFYEREGREGEGRENRASFASPQIGGIWRGGEVN
jgi:hypothetical protein